MAADSRPFAGRAAVVGVGAIGSALAAELARCEAAKELVLADRNAARAAAKAADLSHCAPLGGVRSVSGCGLDDLSGAQVVVIAAGALPPETGTRMDALAANLELYRRLVPQLARANPDAILLVITNPVDLMTSAALALSGFPPERVLGTGTLLDGLRLRAILARELGLDSRAIEAEVAGEHGDSMVPLWSRARAAGEPLAAYAASAGIDIGPGFKERVMREVRRAGWEIRAAKEHSVYAISRCAALIVERLLGLGSGELTLSREAGSAFGQSGLCMSLPSLVGPAGAFPAPNVALSDEEAEGLRLSAESLRPYLAQLGALLGGA